MSERSREESFYTGDLPRAKLGHFISLFSFFNGLQISMVKVVFLNPDANSSDCSTDFGPPSSCKFHWCFFITIFLQSYVPLAVARPGSNIADNKAASAELRRMRMIRAISKDKERRVNGKEEFQGLRSPSCTSNSKKNARRDRDRNTMFGEL